MCYNRHDACPPSREVFPIYVAHLGLVNFRNYERLALDLGPGMTVIHGGNGHGKSNLLEALYLLAIAKSPRASSDRELVRWQHSSEDAYSQVAAVVARDGGELRVQIDIRSAVAGDAIDRAGEPSVVEKVIRVNGLPRKASELVGEINAALFTAQDMDIVPGPPSFRRRYLDILISQLNPRYLKAAQKYQRVLSQRNHLLKSIRAGHSKPGELDFWDDELVSEGQHIMARRAETIIRLSELAGPAYRDLSSDDESLELAYRPSIGIGPGDAEDSMAESYRQALDASRERELAMGFTVTGPHRDDLQMRLDGMDAGLYASRGQCRTVVLAMKLAEARYLMEQRGQEPVLLLDDVLSELDANRRSKVLEAASQYEQCIITTTDPRSIAEPFLSQVSMFAVHRGRVAQEAAPPAG